MHSAMTRLSDTSAFDRDKFSSMASDAGLNVSFRCASAPDWATASESLLYLPVAYSDAMIDYQIAYMRGDEGVVYDISLVLHYHNKPCALWPLSLSCSDGWKIGSPGGRLMPPLFIAGLGLRVIKTQTAACMNFLNQLNSLYPARPLESIESFMEEDGLSEWHCRVMQQGGVAKLQHELFVNLDLDILEIKSRFRKSYKSLITTGEKLWKVSILQEANEPVWNEFRALHFAVSGKLTRSTQSWELQHKAIRDGVAFLVHLRDQNNRMVGGGYFHVTRDEGLYAVGAYDRDLFDKPLGHVVQFHAIQEMQRRNLRWYKIGYRPYPGDDPAPSAKEITIGEFKHGFASHMFPRYRLLHGACPCGDSNV